MRARESDLYHPLWEGHVHKLKPIIAGQSSDSGKLDNQLELLVRSGRDIRHALMMMIPEAWERLPEGEVSPERRAFYQYHSASDRTVGRPCRGHLYRRAYCRHDSGPQRSAPGPVSWCSTTVCDQRQRSRCRSPMTRRAWSRKGRLGPGQIFCVDTIAWCHHGRCRDHPAVLPRASPMTVGCRRTWSPG